MRLLAEPVDDGLKDEHGPRTPQQTYRLSRQQRVHDPTPSASNDILHHSLQAMTQNNANIIVTSYTAKHDLFQETFFQKQVKWLYVLSFIKMYQNEIENERNYYHYDISYSNGR